MLDLEAASIADLELGKREGADNAITFKAECILEVGASGVERTALVVGDGNFFPHVDVTGCVDGFTLCIAVPIVVSIWYTAVINEANCWIDATNGGAGTAGQSIGFENTAERVFAREIVMKRKELSLLGL